MDLAGTANRVGQQSVRSTSASGERSIVHGDVVAPSVGPEGRVDPSEGEHIHWRVSERTVKGGGVQRLNYERRHDAVIIH